MREGGVGVGRCGKLWHTQTKREVRSERMFASCMMDVGWLLERWERRGWAR